MKDHPGKKITQLFFIAIISSLRFSAWLTEAVLVGGGR